jgi:hypothetical protein
MGNYNNRIIPLDDYLCRLDMKRHYDGYVEGLGYAYDESKTIAPKVTRHTYGHHRIYYERKLEISRDTIRKLDGGRIFERPDSGPEGERERPLSGKIMRITLATSVGLFADDATVIGVADDVLIPFVLAGGCVIALVAWIKEFGDIDDYKRPNPFPKPWSTSTPTPWSPQSTPPEPPESDPNDEGIWRMGALMGSLVAGSRLVQEYHSATGNIIKSKRAYEMATRPNIDRRILRASMEERLKRLSDEFESRSLPAIDALRMERLRRIISHERE